MAHESREMNGRYFSHLFHKVSENVGNLLDRLRPPRTGGQDILQLAEALLSGQGEASGVAVAREFLTAYDGLTEDKKISFLTLMGQQFGPDQARLEKALTTFANTPTAKATLEMQEAAESRRQVLFRRITLSPGGTKGLLQMREDVLRNLPAHTELAPVDADLRHLFSSWFHRGFLVMKKLDWTSPANILEKIIRYEAVHQIASWDDLRRRLEPSDRCCFAFFHPTMEDEPLIFVAVALTSEVPEAIAPLLADHRNPIPAGHATSAVFYSISNCQVGLKGVPLGDFLIKQVVEELKQELPSLKTFVTLSPVPGFMRWLAQERRKDDFGSCRGRGQGLARSARPAGLAPGCGSGQDAETPSLARRRRLPAGGPDGFRETDRPGRALSSGQRSPFGENQLAERSHPQRIKTIRRVHGQLPLRA